MTYSMLLSSHRLLKVLEMMALLAVVLAVLMPGWGRAFFARIKTFFAWLARDRRKAIVFSALLPLAIRAAMLPWYPPPLPQIHDEFSYLLQADTFAHGRIANPTPPYWEHFESEYVLLQPSYASQYQPAQGLVLAFGQVFLGGPWWGVWLSMGVMFATLCWTLFYILPPRWALFGTIAAALQFGIFGLWMNSYFGGAVAATAGALIAGSLVRTKTPDKVWSSGALCGFGVIVLFASRPVEALLWLVIAIGWAFLVLARGSYRPSVWRFGISFGLVFAAGAIGLAYYNWRITGNALDPPYLAYQRIYGTPQPFWFQRPFHVDQFRFDEIRDNYLHQLHKYEARYSVQALLEAERDRLRDFWRFFIGPFFTPGLLFAGVLWRDKRVRPWLYVSIPFVLDKATYHAWFPAHSAPETILILVVVIQSWRHLAVWQRRRRIGEALSRNLAAACLVAVLLGGVGRAIEPKLPYHFRHLPPVWESLYPARRLRDDITAKLERIPGKHLLFVEYSPQHCFCEEWIANTADIRNQKIVYSRPFTRASDLALARYLSDHDVWVIQPDSHPWILERLDDSAPEVLREEMAGFERITPGEASE